MAKGTVEERLATLEAEVTWLKSQIARDSDAVIGRTAPDFLDRYVGIFANSPLFEEVVRFTEAEREQEREEAHREVNPSDGKTE